MTEREDRESCWVVTQNGVVVCGVSLCLTRWQAENKVENEKRRLMPCSYWEARPATKEELNPPKWVEEECDD
jgi:hypothetical protein